MRRLKEWAQVAGYTILLVLLLWGFYRLSVSRDAEIREWANSHGYRVVSVRRVWINRSPWYRHKNDDMREVKLRSADGAEHTAYFRWIWFGMEQAWATGDNGRADQ